MPRPTAAALLLCLCACAAAQRPGSCPACPASPAATGAASAPQGPPKLEYPPEEVKVSRLDLELGEGRPEDAERSLRLAVTEFRATGDQERLDEYYAAQAQYYLGEVYRGWFRALPLDPSKGDEAALQKDLEQKAEMLLSAQGHYLRAIRMGNDRWAVASGFRIGELYDALRSDLLDA